MTGGPAFFAAGRPLAATVSIALWWSTAINIVLCLSLAVVAPRWTACTGGRSCKAVERGHSSRSFALLLLLAALLAGGLRWPLAHTGVWADEGWSLRNTISGIAERSRADPGRLAVRAVGWRETLWSYERPTNHPLYSAAARLSLDAWRLRSGRPAPAFDELALRLPSLVAALASVALIGLLLRAWGFPRAGVAAAWLLALHPWHIRYGADGRAYAFVVLFALAAALALTRALRDGSGRAWLLYAVSLWLLVWSQPVGLYLAASLGGAGLADVALGPRARGARLARGARMVAASLLAAMLCLQVMGPNLAQLPEWGRRFAAGSGATPVSAAGVGHYWSLAATGMEAREPDVPERSPDAYPSLADRARTRPWVYPVALGLLPLLAGLGCLRALRRGGPVRPVALGLAAAPPLLLFCTWALDGQWYARFGIFGLPAVVAFLALGLDGAALRLPWPSPRARRLGVPLVLAAGLAGFQAFVAPQTALLVTRPHTPSRELARFFDEASGGQPDGAIRGVLGLRGGNNHIEVYDPWIRELESAEELVALCAEARAKGLPLYVAYGYPRKNRKERAGPFRYLDDPAWFREAALFDAIEVDHLIRVLLYTGRPLPTHGGDAR